MIVSNFDPTKNTFSIKSDISYSDVMCSMWTKLEYNQQSYVYAVGFIARLVFKNSVQIPE